MKPYTTYKPSGVEWIGGIPEHWELSKLKYESNVVLGKMLTTEQKEGYKLAPYLRAQNANWLNVDVTDIKTMWFSTKELEKLRLQKDDLIISEGGEVGRTSIWDNELEECYIQNSVHKVTFNNNNHSKYFLYLFFYFGKLGFFDSIINRISIGHLTYEKLKELLLLLPPFHEQKAIASFIENKSSQIDTLIIQKRRLIELLQEEKIAVINEAVTKGLNPHVRMKDCGIPWLGPIPKHYGIIKLKYLGDIKYGLGTPPKQKQDGLALIRATNVKRGEISEQDLIFVDPEDIPFDRNPVLKENDIIVVRSGAYTGDSAIIPKRYEGSITGYDMVVRINNANPKFISYALLSNYILNNQLDLLRLRAAQPHLNREDLSETLVVLPPLFEQEEITKFIENKWDSIYNSVQKIYNEIELLYEYRTALIRETVTGKIDVRGVK